MDILFVSEYFHPKIMGGGEINLFLLAKSLAKKGFNVHILTSRLKGYKADETFQGIHIHRKLRTGTGVTGIKDNLVRSLLFPISIQAEIKRLGSFDIVHFIGSSVLAAETGCVATVESYPALCPKGDLLYGAKACSHSCSFSLFLGCLLDSDEIGKIKNRFYLKYNPAFWSYVYSYYKRLNGSLKKCNLIAISDYVRSRLRKHGLKSKTIPNMVEFNRFYSSKKKNKKTKIIYLGSLTEYKGPHVLLQAAKGLDCSIDLYGEGILKTELLKIIKKNKLDAKIHQPVDYSMVPKIYAGSDIVVFPSIWPEPFGRIAIEAMASSKPVIASEIGAIPEIVKNAGILVKPGDIDGLRKAIIRLIKNKNIRTYLGNKGRKIAKRYSVESVTRQIIEYYKKIK